MYSRLPLRLTSGRSRGLGTEWRTRSRRLVLVVNFFCYVSRLLLMFVKGFVFFVLVFGVCIILFYLFYFGFGFCLKILLGRPGDRAVSVPAGGHALEGWSVFRSTGQQRGVALSLRRHGQCDTGHY